MKIILLFLLLFSVTNANCSPNVPSDNCTWGEILSSPKNWLTINIPDSIYEHKLVEVNANQVIFTKRYTAVKMLLDLPLVELEEYEALALLGPLYKSVSGTKPYLVRGVSTHYSGNIYANWFPKIKTLTIGYVSLGLPGTQYEFVPLVVNLTDKPDNIYVSSSSAK